MMDRSSQMESKCQAFVDFMFNKPLRRTSTNSSQLTSRSRFQLGFRRQHNQMLLLLRQQKLWKIAVFVVLLLPSTSNSSIKNGLNGSYFRVSGHHFPPFQVLSRVNGTLTYTGSTPNVIYWIAEKFNMKYEIIPVEDSEIAKYGSVQAGLNQIIRKEVDISTLTLVPTIERAQYMDFSYPVSIDQYRLMVPKPAEGSRLFATIRPFQCEVWTCMLFSFVSIAVILTLFAWCYSRCKFFPAHRSYTQSRMNKFGLFSRNAMYITSVVTNQGLSSPMEVNRDSYRILAGLFLLTATVLVNSYSGTLISSLTVSKFQPVINSLEDLANSEDVILTLNSNSVLAQIFNESSNPTFKTIRNAMHRDPKSMYLVPKNGLSNLFALKYAFPTTDALSLYLMNMDLKKTGECRLHLSNQIPIKDIYTFGLLKGNELNSLFSEKIQYLWETGLMIHWIRTNDPSMRVDKCLIAKKKESARQKPIKLADFTSAFFILGIGVGLATLCFLQELLYFNFCRRR